MENYLFFNLDKQGLGVAKIEDGGKLRYIGSILDDRKGRMLTHGMQIDGDTLLLSFKKPIPDADTPPVLRAYYVCP